MRTSSGLQVCEVCDILGQQNNVYIFNSRSELGNVIVVMILEL
jgi:hypothetical protein